MSGKKLVVLGIDGAGFELVQPWIDEGYLRTFRKVQEEGTWGQTQSVLPPVTAPNWKCYSTGLNPAELGIFYWENIAWGKVYFPNERKVSNKEVWDYISDEGFKVGVFGTPLTFPPKKVNGFFWSGPPDRYSKGYTYPAELEQRYEEAGYKQDCIRSIVLEREEAEKELVAQVIRELCTGSELIENFKTDFAQLSCFYINELHHYFWDSELTKEAWSYIDVTLEELLEEGYDVIVMSDHGSSKISRVFNINTWLEEKGYLYLKGQASLRKLGLTQEGLAERLPKLAGMVRALVPKNLINNIFPKESGATTFLSKEHSIDWERSVAVASDQGPIYINPKYRNMKEKLQNELEELDYFKGSAGVYSKEELYRGKYFKEAPDLVIDQTQGLHINSGLGLRKIIDKPNRWIADNSKHGIFMAYGPNLLKLGELKDISILDLTPTILKGFNIDKPKEMEGKILDVWK